MSDALDTNFTAFDISSLPTSRVYKLLASVITPRPIAWVVSQSKQGHVNVAPFSFFNILSSEPPLVAIGFTTHSSGVYKDSFNNIAATKQFVINLVTEATAEAMNATSIDAPHGINEAEIAGLTLAPSTKVIAPRIVDSPVALECEFYQLIDPGPASKILLGKVIYAHVRTSIFSNLERIDFDPSALLTIGRMQGGLGGGYTRTRDVFDMPRPKWSPKPE